jgi:hypothetical protein
MRTKWAEYLKRQITGTDPKAMESEYAYTETSPLTMASTVIFTWASQLKLSDAMFRYAKELQRTDTGGDDDTFDYFPDAMEALYQLCQGIGGSAAKIVYEETRALQWEKKYKGLEYETIDQQFLPWAS